MPHVRLIPRDEGFFPLFNELAKRITRSAELLVQLFGNSSSAHIDRYMAEIKSVEHEADDITHQISGRIDRSFVTPFDREDIHHLAHHLDDVVDLIDGTARRAAMFHIGDVRAPAARMAGIIVEASRHIEAGVTAVKQPRAVAEHARAIKTLEEQGDQVYHEAVGELFRGAPDPLEVIKWKELYDTLERTLDQCQTVATVLESISLKNS